MILWHHHLCLFQTVYKVCIKFNCHLLKIFKVYCLPQCKLNVIAYYAYIFILAWYWSFCYTQSMVYHLVCCINYIRQNWRVFKHSSPPAMRKNKDWRAIFGGCSITSSFVSLLCCNVLLYCCIVIQIKPTCNTWLSASQIAVHTCLAASYLFKYTDKFMMRHLMYELNVYIITDCKWANQMYVWSFDICSLTHFSWMYVFHSKPSNSYMIVIMMHITICIFVNTM